MQLCSFPLALANTFSWPFVPILSNFSEEQWTQNHLQCLSGLSRAHFPTTFLEIAVYSGLQTKWSVACCWSCTNLPWADVIFVRTHYFFNALKCAIFPIKIREVFHFPYKNVTNAPRFFTNMLALIKNALLILLMRGFLYYF